MIVHLPAGDSSTVFDNQSGWSMLPAIDRVYDNQRARAQLGWTPRYDFGYILQRLSSTEDFRSPVAKAVGSKGYHAQAFSGVPYPTE